MIIARTVAEVRSARRGSGGFVPTMGALHEGHLALMRRAKRENDQAIASVFVNPTQFGVNEDFARYPRNLERDAAMAEQAGVDVLFAPSVEEMYPRTPTLVRVPEVTEPFEGTLRPGHFDGVATIVLKLFNAVQPSRAYFGQKDLQQCLVVRRMVLDLNVQVELVISETVREPDGLAMSSRNAYLSAEHREIAPILCRHLLRLASKFRSSADGADRELSASKDAISEAGFALEYLEWVTLDSLQTCRDTRVPSAIVVAARIGNTRLIDNIIVNPSREIIV